MKKIKTACVSFLLLSTTGIASEMVYTPVNPSFGGHPSNGSYLLNNAQAQNDKKASSGSSSSSRSALDRFNDSLQSRLLSQLLADIGKNGTNSGVLDTQDYLIAINQDDDGSLVVTTTDKNTGESTSIKVNGLIAD